MSLQETYIRYGVPNNWAIEYEKKGISAASFKQTTIKNLIKNYNISSDQVKIVKECLIRQPIDSIITQKLLENNRFVCCLCKGQKSDAYIIHHIVEYSSTQDNSYNNLALLCPSDHELAHRTGLSLASKITPTQIKTAKKNWERLVKTENKKKALSTLSIKSKNWRDKNPYKELKSFTENDFGNFFGRKKEIEELIYQINRYNIVGLFGESGTGKTSIVNAGLLPQFKKDNFITISIRCGDEPIKKIREKVCNELIENSLVKEIESIAAIDTFPRFILKVKNILEKIDKNLIIVIDQFEELFTRARESEKEYLSKGIIESLSPSVTNDKLFFLFSLREDYIGELWDWAHHYNLENAWIHQYRIKRLDKPKAYDAIVQPLNHLGIPVDYQFVDDLITELINIGNGLIYPPYLQIVCSMLFEEYKIQCDNDIPLNLFGPMLYAKDNNAESIIADYLSESMLVDLTEEEKLYAKNILDLLTGPEGLRSFLGLKEISRYLNIADDNAKHVIEHLIKKKIVHPIVEEDQVTGYELVHDFLSKSFFEKLGPEAQRAKTTIEIFRKAFRDWGQHGVLASQDRLDILYPNIKQLALNDEEWTFLIKSSFSVYWYFNNRWTALVDYNLLSDICFKLINDKDERIAENAISTLGKLRSKKAIPILIKIIESPDLSPTIRDAAISQFSNNLWDKKVINVLKNVIKTNKNFKLRKSAIYAFGNNLRELAKSNQDIFDSELIVLFDALNDSMTQVRKQVADVLSYLIVTEKSTEPLINRISRESSFISRKAIVSALNALVRRNISKERIIPILENIQSNPKEDYRVREEARNGLL